MNKDELLKQAEKIKQAQEKGSLDDFINKNLSSQASSKLKQILGDKQATERLMSTPQAKELFKKLTENK